MKEKDILKEIATGLHSQIRLMRALFNEKYGDRGDLMMFINIQQQGEEYKAVEKKLFTIMDKPERFPQYKTFIVN